MTTYIPNDHLGTFDKANEALAEKLNRKLESIGLKEQMNISIVATAIKYRVDFSTEDFLKLWDYESKFYQLDTLGERLEEEFEVYEVEYNPHFGPSIFFTLDLDIVVDPQEVVEFIEEYMKEIKEINA